MENARDSAAWYWKLVALTMALCAVLVVYKSTIGKLPEWRYDKFGSGGVSRTNNYTGVVEFLDPVNGAWESWKPAARALKNESADAVSITPDMLKGVVVQSVKHGSAPSRISLVLYNSGTMPVTGLVVYSLKWKPAKDESWYKSLPSVPKSESFGDNDPVVSRPPDAKKKQDVFDQVDAYMHPDRQIRDRISLPPQAVVTAEIETGIEYPENLSPLAVELQKPDNPASAKALSKPPDYSQMSTAELTQRLADKLRDK